MFSYEGVCYEFDTAFYCIHYIGDLHIPVMARQLSRNCYCIEAIHIGEFPQGGRMIHGFREVNTNDTFFVHPSMLTVKKHDKDYHETLELMYDDDIFIHLYSSAYQEVNFVVL
jgi:hypothetical protein